MVVGATGNNLPGHHQRWRQALPFGLGYRIAFEFGR